MSESILGFKAPTDITPERFFMEWLPSYIEGSKEKIEETLAGFTESVAVKVTGEGGGEWTVKVKDGKPEFVTGLDSEAFVTFTLSKQNFIDSITGQLDDIMVMPQGFSMPEGDQSAEKIKEKARNTIGALKTLNGVIRVAADDPGSPLEVDIKFAGEMRDNPDCIIKVKQEDVKAMGSGELDPQMAFMTGRVKIEGDSSLLMQLTALLMFG